jgi:ribosomal protein S18 acetylase RimI-like enzyme
VNSRHRTNAAVDPGESGSSRSSSQPTRRTFSRLQENSLRIRDAKLSDVTELAALMSQLGYETTSAEMTTRLKSILRDPRYRTLVAKIDNELCGMIGTLTHFSHEHNDPSGKILALVVSKKQRRNGVGRALITAAEKDFADRNVKRVTLTARFEREEAHQFYEKLRYSRTGFRFGKNLAPISE